MEDCVVHHRMLEAVAAVQAKASIVSFAAGQHLNLCLLVVRAGSRGVRRAGRAGVRWRLSGVGNSFGCCHCLGISDWCAAFAGQPGVGTGSENYPILFRIRSNGVVCVWQLAARVRIGIRIGMQLVCLLLGRGLQLLALQLQAIEQLNRGLLDLLLQLVRMLVHVAVLMLHNFQRMLSEK